MKRTFFIFLLMCIICSCSNVGGDKHEFPQYEYCMADSVAINEILAPQTWNGAYMNEYYLIFYSPKSDEVFWRYSLPDFIFMGSSSSKGEGPDDVGQPYIWANNLPSESMWFYDGSKREIKRYHVGPEELELTKTISSHEIKDGITPFTSYVINDKYIVFDRLKWEACRTDILICNLSDSVRVLDSLSTLAVTEVVEYAGGRGATSTNVPGITIYGSRMMVYYPMLNMGVRYDITADGHFKEIKTIGDTYTYDDVKNLDWKTRNKESKSITSVMASTDSHIFMSKIEYDRESVTDPETGKADNVMVYKDLSVLVYDWDLNPVKKIDLEYPEAHKIHIDVHRNKIYAWDDKKDFENMYIYDFSLDE